MSWKPGAADTLSARAAMLRVRRSSSGTRAASTSAGARLMSSTSTQRPWATACGQGRERGQAGRAGRPKGSRWAWQQQQGMGTAVPICSASCKHSVEQPAPASTATHLGERAGLPHKLPGARGADVGAHQALAVHLIVQVDAHHACRGRGGQQGRLHGRAGKGAGQGREGSGAAGGRVLAERETTQAGAGARQGSICSSPRVRAGLGVSWRSEHAPRWRLAHVTVWRASTQHALTLRIASQSRQVLNQSRLAAAGGAFQEDGAAQAQACSKRGGTQTHSRQGSGGQVWTEQASIAGRGRGCSA